MIVQRQGLLRKLTYASVDPREFEVVLESMPSASGSSRLSRLLGDPHPVLFVIVFHNP